MGNLWIAAKIDYQGIEQALMPMKFNVEWEAKIPVNATFQ